MEKGQPPEAFCNLLCANRQRKKGKKGNLFFAYTACLNRQKGNLLPHCGQKENLLL